MPRAQRILGDGFTYHVVSNCNAGEFLFRDACDFQAFLRHLEECRQSFGFELHAYCLLHSHIHLILTTRNGVFLDKVMYEICQRFARRYNKNNARCGHFWKDRYFSKVISSDAYGLVCLRYLHMNPVRAGLVDHPARWPWSCARHYLHKDQNSLLTLLPSYLSLSSEEMIRGKLYQRWLNSKLISNAEEKFLMLSRTRVGSKRYQQIVRKLSPLLPAK